MTYDALWWAKVQSGGAQAVPPDTPPVAGLLRATEPSGEHIWLVPDWPEGRAVLDELGAAPVPVEQPNETARVLAICVACCWQERQEPPWPGVPTTLARVRSSYAALRGRREQSSDLTVVVGALRRLVASGWILWNDDIRLGPRVATWRPAQLVTLREMCRLVPEATA